VRQDPRFVRDGDDLVTAVDVSAPMAALGTRVTVPTIEDAVELDIPAGSQPHETLIVRGAGMPALRGHRRGDLRVVVNVVVPRHLDREQRELYERLAGSMREHNLRSDEACSGRSSAPSAGSSLLRIAVRVGRGDAEVVLAELL